MNLGFGLDGRLLEVLILVGFDDIGCDIGIFGVDGGKVSEMLDFTGFGGIFI